MTALLKPGRRLTRKQVDKVLREYDLPGRVRAILEPLAPYVFENPRLPSAAYDERVGDSPARYRDTVVLTTIGPLGISVYDDWIACVFDDAEQGRIFVGASEPSGKWNHHAFVSYVHKPTSKAAMVEELDRVLAHFRSRLAWITNPAGTYR